MPMYTYDWYFALIFVVVVVVVSSGASRVNGKRKKLKVKNIHSDAQGVSVVHNNKNNKISNYVRPSLFCIRCHRHDLFTATKGEWLYRIPLPW